MIIVNAISPLLLFLIPLQVVPQLMVVCVPRTRLWLIVVAGHAESDGIRGIVVVTPAQRLQVLFIK